MCVRSEQHLLLEQMHTNYVSYHILWHNAHQTVCLPADASPSSQPPNNRLSPSFASQGSLPLLAEEGGPSATVMVRGGGGGGGNDEMELQCGELAVVDYVDLSVVTALR